MSEDRTIGLCSCPVCSSKRASLRLSAKRLVYIVCNSCNMQAFARSDRSDAAMRELLISEPAAAPAAPAQAPAPAAAAPAAKLDPEQRDKLAEAIDAEDAQSGFTWGLLRGLRA